MCVCHTHALLFLLLQIHTHIINPLSLSNDEIYGCFDPSTHEWTDGVLAKIMRIVCKDESSDFKWILFDGPVDTLWIESMNTLLDDNKLLTLLSGERISMPPQVDNDSAEASTNNAFLVYMYVYIVFPIHQLLTKICVCLLARSLISFLKTTCKPFVRSRGSFCRISRDCVACWDDILERRRSGMEALYRFMVGNQRRSSLEAMLATNYKQVYGPNAGVQAKAMQGARSHRRFELGGIADKDIRRIRDRRKRVVCMDDLDAMRCDIV